MKANIIFNLMISIIMLGCTPQKTSPIEGTWKLVYGIWTSNDTVVYEFPGKLTGSQIKMWSKDYFVFAGRFKIDTAFSDNSGGGRYKLQGNRYEEDIQYHTETTAVGKTAKMLLEIRNDTLIQTWPLLDNGQIDKSNFDQEKYVRLD
jgi:hypothetical protein